MRRNFANLFSVCKSTHWSSQKLASWEETKERKINEIQIKIISKERNPMGRNFASLLSVCKSTHLSDIWIWMTLSLTDCHHSWEWDIGMWHFHISWHPPPIPPGVIIFPKNLMKIEVLWEREFELCFERLQCKLFELDMFCSKYLFLYLEQL